MSDRPFYSVIVSNWQGEAWIARVLSALELSAAHVEPHGEVIVVDDASTDDSCRIVRERFPRVRLVVNARNDGFARATMRGVREARGRVVVLCNNDLVVKQDFLPCLLSWFEGGRAQLGDGEAVERRRIFGVGARTIGWWDGKPNQLRMAARWRGARVATDFADPRSPCRTLFLQAGAAAYNRRLLLALGGLSELFEPGYWEDYDLAWRAARAGFVNIYDPRAVALHQGGGSMTRRFGARGVARIKARNHLLFEWSNLSDPRLVAASALRYGYDVGREWLRGDMDAPLTRGLADASARIGQALWRRYSRPAGVVSDDELLSLADGS